MRTHLSAMSQRGGLAFLILAAMIVSAGVARIVFAQGNSFECVMPRQTCSSAHDCTSQRGLCTTIAFDHTSIATNTLGNCTDGITTCEDLSDEISCVYYYAEATVDQPDCQNVVCTVQANGAAGCY